MTSSDTYRVGEKERQKKTGDAEGTMKLYPFLSTSQCFHVQPLIDEQTKCTIFISSCFLCMLWTGVKIHGTP